MSGLLALAMPPAASDIGCRVGRRITPLRRRRNDPRQLGTPADEIEADGVP
jgi:hypothetical protein